MRPMRLRIQQSRPRTLNEAIRLAVEIEAFCRAERQRRQDIGFARGANSVNESKDLDYNTCTHVNQEIEQLCDELGSSQKKKKFKFERISSNI